MIRYLDLTDQLWDKDIYTEEELKDCFEFAWYNTVTCKIMSFNGENVWSCWGDFESDFRCEINDNDRSIEYYDIQRFKNLFPNEKQGF